MHAARPASVFPVLIAALTAMAVHAANPVLRDANPDMLSGGIFSALADDPVETRRVAPARARAGFSDLSKGRAPLVLDARVGINTRLGDDPSLLSAAQRGQAETHIVRSNADPDLLLATFQEGRFPDSGSITCGYATSRDGGLTWTRALIPNLTIVTAGQYNRATDPVAAAGPQGELYLQTLASVEGVFARAAVVVSRSFDAGATWSPPATIFESPTTQIGPDKNWLAVNDHVGSPTAGRLVATWTNFLRTSTGAAVSNPLVASTSDDRGVTWTAPVEITPQTSRNQGSQPVFLPDGSLVVIYVTFLDPNNVTDFRIECKRSLDGGSSFPSNSTVVVDRVAGWDDPDLRDGIFLPAAAVARQTGEMFVAYTGVVNGSPRILVTKSSNGGTTWTTPAVVSDQPHGSSVMNPAAAASPDGRSVAVVFMDKRDAPDGRSFADQYAAFSLDGGATWQPNLRLTEMSSDIRLGPATTRGFMLGDYMGLAPSLAPDQPCVAVWCDTRTGDSDPYAVRFALSTDTSFRSWSVARFTRQIVNATDLDTLDLDHDGYSNRLEYALGTDPLHAESGEALHTRRSGDTLDVMWTERTDAVGQSYVIDAHADASTGPSVFPQRSLTASELPVAAAGLRWRGERYFANAASSIFAAHARLAASGMRVSEGTFATSNSDARLGNLSTRGETAEPSRLLIAGFVLDGNKTVLLRAAGPALASLGIAGGLADPRLTLATPASGVLQANDNWQETNLDTEVFARLGAFQFPPNSLDAALVVQLGPQSYTASVSGGNNAGGVTLVEVYDADPQPGAARFLNLSTRGFVGGLARELIAGFVVRGTQPRRILLRGIGPTLAAFGVAGYLPDPALTLFRGNAPIAASDDWERSRSPAAISAAAARVGAFPLAAASLDSALLVTLAPGAYTAVIEAADGGTGTALVEVYDVD